MKMWLGENVKVFLRVISLLGSCYPKAFSADISTEWGLGSYLLSTQYYITKQQRRSKNKLVSYGISVLKYKTKRLHTKRTNWLIRVTLYLQKEWVCLLLSAWLFRSLAKLRMFYFVLFFSYDHIRLFFFSQKTITFTNLIVLLCLAARRRILL